MEVLARPQRSRRDSEAGSQKVRRLTKRNRVRWFPLSTKRVITKHHFVEDFSPPEQTLKDRRHATHVRHKKALENHFTGLFYLARG